MHVARESLTARRVRSVAEREAGHRIDERDAGGDDGAQ